MGRGRLPGLWGEPAGSPLGVGRDKCVKPLFLLSSGASLSVSLPAPPADLYCTLEVDSFGYFVSKAKTRVFRDTTEPKWDEVSGGGLVSP